MKLLENRQISLEFTIGFPIETLYRRIPKRGFLKLNDFLDTEKLNATGSRRYDIVERQKSLQGT